MPFDGSMSAKGVIEMQIPRQRRGLGMLLKIRKNPLKFFQELEAETDGFAWLSIAGRKVLVLNDATAIEYIFTKGSKNYHKGIYNFGLKPVFGDGIFLAEGEHWWQQRRAMAPNFATRNFDDFTRHVSASIDSMLNRWEPRIQNGEPIDFALEASWLTFDVILRTLYHQDSGDAAFEIRRCLGSFLEMAESRIWTLFNLPLKLTMLRPKHAKTMRFLHKLTNDLIQQRRIDGTYPDDLLSRLIQSHGVSRKEQILLRDNILSFMLAGQETTGNAISWSFYELCRNTDKRKKLVEELDRVFADGTLDYAKVRELHYTNQIFSEVMRKYAPAWTMSRHALNDDIIALDDGRQLRVPKGSTVMLPAYTVHHREKYWEDPEAFMPERFAGAAVKARPKYAYFPFGGGNRLCLGFRLAELEGMLSLAVIYNRFDVKLVPGQQVNLEPVITLRPDRPIMIRLIPKSNAKPLQVAEADTTPQSDLSDLGIGTCPYTKRA